METLASFGLEQAPSCIDKLQALKRELLLAGRPVFDLTMINPDLPPPRFLLDKLLEASFKPANHRYAVSRGVRKLREGFSRKYQKLFGLKLDPEREVCATMGTKDAVLQATRLLAAPGDSVLVASPTYPAHLFALKLNGLSPVFFGVEPPEEAILAQIEGLCTKQQGTRHKIKLALLNFPNNPTGLSVSVDFWRKLLTLSRRYDFFVLNDFVYGEMGFGAKLPVSLLSVSAGGARAAESYSLSKAYSVPGWRVGALLGNEELCSRVAWFKSHLDYGLFLPLQLAAGEALASAADLALPYRRAYEERAKVLASGLAALGFEVSVPQAGASVWAKLPCRSQSSGEELVLSLAQESGILVLPGDVFGSDYKQFLRFALVIDEARMREMLEIFQNFMQARA